MRLGHLVLYVSDLQKSRHFYQEVIGLQLSGTLFDGRAITLTGGRTHHELMLVAAGEGALRRAGGQLGLHHFAFCVGEGLEVIRCVKTRLETHGVSLLGASDHTITYSLYLHDPDGNMVELYADNPSVDWRTDDSWLRMPVRSLPL